MSPLYKAGKWKTIACTMCLIFPFAALPQLDDGFTTIASWYGPGFQGRKTASGETFDQNKLTAASPTLPFGTKLTVKNLRNGRTVDVVINDRGPFVRGRKIDLSRAAARDLGIGGTAPVVCYACGASPDGTSPDADQYRVAEPSNGITEQAEVAEVKPFTVKHTVHGTPIIARTDDAFQASAPSKYSEQTAKPIRPAHEPVENQYLTVSPAKEPAQLPKPIMPVSEPVELPYVTAKPADEPVQQPKPVVHVPEQVEPAYIAAKPVVEPVQKPKPVAHFSKPIERSYVATKPAAKTVQISEPIWPSSEPVKNSILSYDSIYHYAPPTNPVKPFGRPVEHTVLSYEYINHFAPMTIPLQNEPTPSMEGTVIREHTTRVVAHHRIHRSSRDSHDHFRAYIASARVKGRRFERSFDHMTVRLAHACRGITSSFLAAL